MDSEELRRFIKNFSFDQCKRGSQGFNRILIQLFGFLGHGKSSFINTCIYVWEDGEFQNWAKARGTDGGQTTERIPYKITENITLVDNRGCKALEDHESGEIFAQLGNLLPIGKSVDMRPGFDLVERITKAEKEVRSSDFIVPVFVRSIKSITTEEEKESIKTLLHTARNLTGVFPIVVLTSKTSGSLTQTEGLFRDFGVEKIFSFENYTEKDHMKTRGKHEGVLNFFCEVIKEVQFRVEHPRDPVKEIQERKRFVLNFIHESTKREEQRKLERKRALDKALQEKRLKEEEEMRQRQRLKEEREQEMELKSQEEEFARERERENARREQEVLRALEEKKKNKNKLFGIFKARK